MVCLLFIGILSACNNGNNSHSSSESTAQSAEVDATITVSAPEMHSMYNLGQEVKIIGKIESSNELHGYKLSIIQKSDGQVVFSKEFNEHEKSYDFSEAWKNEVNGMQDMELRVIVALDHNNHTKTETVDFHCHGKM